MPTSARVAEDATRLSHFHSGANAQQLVDNTVDDAVVLASGHKPVEHIGEARLKAHRFILAAGGPGCDVTFIFVDGEVEQALFDYFEPDNVRAHRVIHGDVAKIVYAALLKYSPTSGATS